MKVSELINEVLNRNENEVYPDTNFIEENSDVKTTTQYNYEDEPTIKVIKNPEEYIIPEELPACKMLWDRGIETYMCGNYEDKEHQGRWIAIQWHVLSQENKAILDKLIQTDSRYSFGHYYKLTVPFGKNVAEELCSLVEPLKSQDTIRFISGEQFLDSYKKQGGEMYVNDDGRLLNHYNPKLLNATLEEALKNTGKEKLFDPKLDRVYEDKIFMDWHDNYINHINHINEDWVYNAHYENGVESHRIK